MLFILGIPPASAEAPGSNSGAVAGGVTFFIIVLVILGVALGLFIFWFM